MKTYDVCGIGNAIVDVLAVCEDAFLEKNGIAKGSMTLIDAARADFLYGQMNPEIEMSGGSAANTAVGVTSLGGTAVYLGKIAGDKLGDLYASDLHKAGVDFDVPRLVGGEPTARCMIFVTPDAQRSMNTFLGASSFLGPEDIDAELIQASKITYLEGYLFDRPAAQEAFFKAALIAHAAEKKLALTLSDSFCVNRHLDAFRVLVQKQVDILFCNEGELMALYQANRIEEAVAIARQECDLVVTTRGDKGVLVASPSEIVEVLPEPVAKVIDTTGAGDLFAAGFMFGMSKEMTMEGCGRLGNLAAGEAISHFGPRPQVALASLV